MKTLPFKKLHGNDQGPSFSEKEPQADAGFNIKLK